MTRRLSRIKNDFILFSKIELILAGFCLAVWLLLQYLKYLSLPEFSYLFFVLAALSGYLVGLEFPLANKIYGLGYRKPNPACRQAGTAPLACGKDKTHSKSAGLLYCFDLFGAWMAALIVSIAFVPVIGIIKTCLILAFLKLISSVFVILFRN